MNKKSGLFIGMLLLAVCGNTYAQGFFTRVGLGYAVPQAGQSMDGTATPYSGSLRYSTSVSGTTTTTNIAYDIKKASFSSGLHGTIAAGYLFNEHVGIDVAFDGLLSAKKYTLDGYSVPLSPTSNISFTQKARCVLLTPSLLLQTNGKINLYTRLGIALPLATKVFQDQAFTNLPGAGAVVTQEEFWEVKSSFSLGFSAAAGVNFRLNNRVKFFVEGSFLSLSVFAKESNLTDVTLDGQGGYLQQVPVDQRKVIYSNSFTAVANDYYHQPTYSQPFSNVALNFGLHYNLGQAQARTKGKNDVKSRRR